MDNLKFPIGKYSPPENITENYVRQSIESIAALPEKIREAVAKMDEQQYDQSYRPGGWTIRQVVYHIGDSHLHSYIRFKWSLTEDTPLIKAYEQDGWAGTADSTGADMDLALDFIDVLHKRWVNLLNSIQPADWDRAFVHPEGDRTLSLKYTAGMYAWHGEHHLAHLQSVSGKR